MVWSKYAESPIPDLMYLVFNASFVEDRYISIAGGVYLPQYSQ